MFFTAQLARDLSDTDKRIWRGRGSRTTNCRASQVVLAHNRLVVKDLYNALPDQQKRPALNQYASDLIENGCVFLYWDKVLEEEIIIEDNVAIGESMRQSITANHTSQAMKAKRERTALSASQTKKLEDLKEMYPEHKKYFNMEDMRAVYMEEQTKSPWVNVVNEEDLKNLSRSELIEALHDLVKGDADSITFDQWLSSLLEEPLPIDPLNDIVIVGNVEEDGDELFRSILNDDSFDDFIGGGE